MADFRLNSSSGQNVVESKMLATNIKEGDMIVHNFRIYRYEGATGDNRGTFVCIETGKRISYSEVSTSLQSANIISDPGVLNDRTKNGSFPGDAIIRGQAKNALIDGRFSESSKWMRHVLTVDLEASRLDSAAVSDYNNLRQIGYSDMNLAVLAEKSGHARFNRSTDGVADSRNQPGINNVAIVNDTVKHVVDTAYPVTYEEILKKFRQNDANSYNALFKKETLKVGRQTIVDGHTTTIGQMYKLAVEQFAGGANSPEALHLAESIRAMGDQSKVVSTFASGHRDNKSAAAFMQGTMQNLADALEQQGTVGSAHTNFDNHYLRSMSKSGKMGNFYDTRLHGALLLERMFPEASKNQLNFVEKFGQGIVSRAKALKTAGTDSSAYLDVDMVQKSYNAVVESVGRGFSNKYAAMTSVDTLHNVLWAEVFNGGRYQRELHSGSADARMQNDLILDMFRNPKKFLGQFAEHNKKFGKSVQEGFLDSAFRFEMYKNITAQLTPFGGENTSVMVNRHMAEIDKLLGRTSETADRSKFNTLFERISNEEIARTTPLNRKIADYFGGNTIKASLGGVFMAAGVQSAVTKLDKQFNQVKSAHEKEGMSHNSFQTIIRRMALTQFGSGFLGKGKTFVNGLLKNVFMTKGSTTGTFVEKALGNLNSMVDNLKDFKPVNAFQDLRKALYNYGESIHTNQIKYGNNPIWKSMGGLLKRFGADSSKKTFLGTLKDFNYDIRSFARQYTESKMGTLSEKESMKINRAYSIFSRRNLNANDPMDVFRYRARKYVYAGMGTAVGINLLAGSYMPKEHEDQRDVKPNDLYTKEAFANQRYKLTNDNYQKATLSNALNMRNKGMADTSPMRNMQRNNTTDFGSKREAFNPTTTEYAKSMSTESLAYAPATRTGQGFYGKIDNRPSIDVATNASNNVAEMESNIFDAVQSQRENAMFALKEQSRSEYREEVALSTVAQIYARTDLFPKYFNDSEEKEIPQVVSHFDDKLSFASTKATNDDLIHSDNRATIADTASVAYKGFVGYAEPYYAPTLPELTNRYTNEYQNNPIGLSITREDHNANSRTMGFDKLPVFGMNDTSTLSYLSAMKQSPQYETIRDNSNALGGFIRTNLTGIQNVGDNIKSAFDLNGYQIQPREYMPPTRANLQEVVASPNFNQSYHTAVTLDSSPMEQSRGTISSMMVDSTPKQSIGMSPLSLELLDKLTINAEAIGHTQESNDFDDSVVNLGMQA